METQQIIQVGREDLEAIVASQVEKVLAQQASADQGFLRMEKAAAFLDLTPAALRLMEKRGKVPSHRVGKRILFDKAELRALVKGA
jgi:hypothetical protein